METELFMECEEEELEPWQQVDDSVDEDDVDFLDDYCQPVEDSPSPPPGSETPPPEAPPPHVPPPSPAGPSASAPVRIVSTSAFCLPAAAAAATTAPVQAPPPAPPLVAQAQPLILTQTAGGTFLLPATAHGTGSGTPILLTTQGFQLPAVVNAGAPLVLNLQPGQTVQPLTLIQSPSLGQLVRPGVGVAPVRCQGQTIQAKVCPAPPGGPARPGFAAVQLPPTLTLRSGPAGPVKLQVSQVSGVTSLKLAGSPSLPSAPANGVDRATPLGSAPSPSPPVTAPAVDSPRVVMSVEEFYYGTYEGDLNLRKPPPLGIKTSSFTCQICSHLADNNLRLMQHVLRHSELVEGGDGERQCCRFCYRQFSSPTQLQSHQEQVHGPAPSTSMCRICEWAFENEPAFLNHMKSNHKPGEMPYVCQVCSYRSSFYTDVLQHFASFHRDSRFLLCVFCLKVTRNPVSYQQHLLRHQVSQAFHCNRCRLQFVFLKDKMQHKLENHRSFRRPAQLEGLLPGSKVTIRTYGKIKPPMTSAGSRLLQNPASLVQPIKIKTEPQKPQILKSPSITKCPKSPTKRGLSRRDFGRTLSGDGERLMCLECGTDASEFSAHYPTHVHCLLCPYSSCCSRAYAGHMIHHHLPRPREKVLPPPCAFLLRCSHCDFRPPSADRMAQHLAANPEHRGAICCRRTYVEPDIHFCHRDGRRSPGHMEPDQNQDLPDPSWRSADSWKPWKEGVDTKTSIVPFSEACGPQHFLSRNSDAIDFFSLLFPATLVELITKETNAHAKTSCFLASYPLDWTPVTTHEVKGFIGLVILMGIHSLPDLSQYWSWNHYDNSYTFYRAMSFKRFKQIAANICMGSILTNEYSGRSDATDPLHIFRPMLSILGGAMWSAYQPNCCLTIDRALLPSLEDDSCCTKGNPGTQPQVWLLCDSKSGYCHRFFIQGGQETGRDLGFSVVLELVKGLENKHHQLFLANSLTSVPLMQKLLDQGIYSSSSFPPPSPVLPRQLWEDGHLEKPGQFLQRQCGPLLATRWRDTKEMGCLSTNAAPGEPDTVWRRSQTKVGELDPIGRPMAFRLLQENMRGVDICKQLLACNPLGGIPQDRHWRSLFWFLVNLSIVNAFIILRESRKDNPPAWVQDGLFTQVNFRKRLGNQLAKCAQKYFETIEIAGSRIPKTEPSSECTKQRHKMMKISKISKRCRNCNLKNMRHESVYGCVICKANLCKQPRCFWEFHGLSPQNKGSTRLGFLKDKISGAIEVEEVAVDATMAPLDDLDFSDDEKLDELEDVEKPETTKEEVNSPVKDSARDGHAQPVVPSASKEREDFLTARQLRIAMFALCDGLRQASRVFSTEMQVIRSWLKEARRHSKQTDEERQADAAGTERMVAWVLSMREQQLPITEGSLFHKASMLKKKGAFGDSFRISYDWAVSFLLRQRLGVRAVGRAPSLARGLPPSLEAKVTSFRRFTQKVFRVHKLAETCVAAMDELCLFVDLRLAQDKFRSSEALEFMGSSPLVTVYLTVLADGTLLPSLLLTTRQLLGKVLPEFMLLEASTDGLSVEETLDLWTNRVWQRHLSGLAQAKKSMLVLDRHREHLGDRFLGSISGSRCLPAVIPAGCSSHLQPLEMCLKPALQRHLLSRWSEFTARNPSEMEDKAPQQLQAHVTELLVDWLVEALTQLNTVPQLWKQSFDLTGILPTTIDGSEEDRTSSKPEKVQSDLLKTLAEKVLGTEATATESPDRLELEDIDDSDEGQGEQEQDEKDEGMEVEEKNEETDRKDGKQSQEEGWTETRDKEPGTVEDTCIIEDRTGGPQTLEEDRTGGSKTLEEDRTGGSKTLEEDRTGGSKTLEEDRTGGSKTLEKDRTGGSKTLEEDRTGGPQTLEEDRTGGSKTLEEDRTGGSKTLEEDRTGGSKTLEEDRTGGSKTLEEDRTGGSKTLEKDRTGGSKTLEEDRTGGSKTLEEDRTGGSKTLEEDRTGGSKTLEEDRTGGSKTLEEDRTGGSKTLEKDRTGGSKTLEEDRTGGPQTLEEDRTGGSKTLEEDRTGGSKTLEEDRTGGSKTLEEDRTGGSKTLEEDRTGGPQTLEEDRTGGSKTLEEDRTGGSKTLEEDRTGGSKTLEEDRTEGSKTLEKDTTGGPQTLEEDRTGGPQTLEEDRTGGSKTLEEDRTGGPQTLEEDSEEEEREVKEDQKEVNKERRETRIVIGEEVGDEWKLTVKSRNESVEAEEEEDVRMD